jgi:hypothetical protein
MQFPQQPQSPPKPEENKKLEQFLEELNDLLDNYQYEIKASLQFSALGIIPRWGVADKVPPKRKPKKPRKKPIKSVKKKK